jgi:pimeloyl-ACP methyl ester carboxylesterase
MVMHPDHASTDFAEGADGTRLFLEQWGDGPAVCLSDGIACDGFVWKYLRPELAQQHRVVHWHYRGHGRSGPPLQRERVTIADCAHDLHAVLDKANVERVTLVGHSMGTQVCLEAYRQRPERVSAMVLLCGSYGRITRTFHSTDVLHHWVPRVIEWMEQHPGLVRALWSRGPAEFFVFIARMAGEVDSLRTRTEDLLPYFEHIATLDPSLFMRMLLAAGEHSAEDLLPYIKVPVLIVAAERDSFTPTRYAEQMARQIPDVEFLMVPGGSHSSPIEQPELINRRIKHFLETRVTG